MNICKRQTFIGKMYLAFKKSILGYLLMYLKILGNITSCANEACFIGQRSKLQYKMKPTSCTYPENTCVSLNFRSIPDGRR